MSTLLEKQFQLLAERVLKLLTLLDNFSELKKNIEDNNNTLNELKVELALLSGKVLNNEIRIKDLKCNVDTLKADLNNLDKLLSNKASLSLDNYNRISKLKDTIHKIHVQLTENDGQTNQCLVWLLKIEKKINALHPISPDVTSTQSITISNIPIQSDTPEVSEEAKDLQKHEDLFKAVIKKCCITLIVTIFLAVSGYIFYHFKKVIVLSMYNEIHSELSQSVVVKSFTENNK